MLTKLRQFDFHGNCGKFGKSAGQDNEIMICISTCKYDLKSILGQRTFNICYPAGYTVYHGALVGQFGYLILILLVSLKNKTPRMLRHRDYKRIEAASALRF